MFEFYSSKLDKKKTDNLYRILFESDSISATKIKRINKKLICFASNDYFGLSQNAKVKKSAINAIKKYGVGATASRFVTGNSSLYKKLEEKISKIKNQDDAIVFSSGYQTLIGIIPALVEKGDLVLADKLMHSSTLEAVKLSDSKLLRFSHNDIFHAEKILLDNRQNYKKCIIITESIFSMDGDLGKVDELLELAKKFNCLFVVDYAHDLFLEKPIRHKNLLIVGTLSKAIGTLGGYVSGNKDLIDYLRNFSKSLIYSTALPPSILASSLTALQVIEKNNLGKKSLENAQYFCELLGFPKPKSAIVPVIIGDDKKVIEIAKNIEEKGFVVSAIRPPTVEEGKSRLRITFSSEHKKNHIIKLYKIIKNLLT